MKFDISKIQKETGSSMEISYRGPFHVKTVTESVAIVDDIVIEGSITNFDEIYWLDAQLSYMYEADCNRCLASFDTKEMIKVNEKFSTRVVDDDTYAFEGHTIDLTKAVLDNIILNMPSKLLCMETCKGLCKKCGQDFNKGTCDCNKGEQKEGPFDVLKDLLP